MKEIYPAMKTYLRAWWRGIGVLGLYFCLSITVAVFGFVAEALPENVRWLVGVPLLLFACPPLLYWVFRWVYPEGSTVKIRFSRDRSGTGP